MKLAFKKLFKRYLRATKKKKGKLAGKCWISEKMPASRYVRISARKNGKILREYLHRLSWEFANKKSIPVGLEILHACDNKRCINPKHLSLGTHQQNMQEAKDRKRMPRGEKHKLAKLNSEIVREIRNLYCAKISQKDLAKMFGVSQVSISNILIRRTWWWLDEKGFTKIRSKGISVKH